jgi:hypothetical protein
MSFVRVLNFATSSQLTPRKLKVVLGSTDSVPEDFRIHDRIDHDFDAKNHQFRRSAAYIPLVQKRGRMRILLVLLLGGKRLEAFGIA